MRIYMHILPIFFGYFLHRMREISCYVGHTSAHIGEFLPWQL